QVAGVDGARALVLAVLIAVAAIRTRHVRALVGHAGVGRARIVVVARRGIRRVYALVTRIARVGRALVVVVAIRRGNAASRRRRVHARATGVAGIRGARDVVVAVARG